MQCSPAAPTTLSLLACLPDPSFQYLQLKDETERVKEQACMHCSPAAHLPPPQPAPR